MRSRALAFAFPFMVACAAPDPARIAGELRASLLPGLLSEAELLRKRTEPLGRRLEGKPSVSYALDELRDQGRVWSVQARELVLAYDVERAEELFVDDAGIGAWVSYRVMSALRTSPPIHVELREDELPVYGCRLGGAGLPLPGPSFSWNRVESAPRGLDEAAIAACLKAEPVTTSRRCRVRFEWRSGAWRARSWAWAD